MLTCIYTTQESLLNTGKRMETANKHERKDRERKCVEGGVLCFVHLSSEDKRDVDDAEVRNIAMNHSPRAIAEKDVISRECI